jgi:hypothetical protein
MISTVSASAMMMRLTVMMVDASEWTVVVGKEPVAISCPVEISVRTRSLLLMAAEMMLGLWTWMRSCAGTPDAAAAAMHWDWEEHCRVKDWTEAEGCWTRKAVMMAAAMRTSQKTTQSVRQQLYVQQRDRMTVRESRGGSW